IWSGTLSAQNVIGDVDEYIKELEGMSLDEAKDFLRTEYDNYLKLKEWRNFFDIKEDQANVTKEDEEYTESFSALPSKEAISRFYKYWNDLYMFQTYEYPETKIELESDSHVRLTGDLDYSAKAIYYADGTVDSTFRALRRLNRLNTAKMVDSIRVEGDYVHIKDYSTYKTAKDLNIEGGKVKIDDLSDNYVKITLTGTACDIEEIDALNAEGKVLKRISKGMGSTEQWEKVDLYFERFEKIGKMIDRFKSLDEIKNTLRKEFRNLPSLNEETNTRYIEALYKGNISSLVLYKIEDRIRITEEKTLVNHDASFNQGLICVFDKNEDKYGFMDKAGNLAITPQYEKLQEINHLYYSLWKDDAESYEYYYLDTEEKKLNLLPGVEHMHKVNETYAIAQREDKYALLGQEAKEISPYIYDYMEDIFNCRDLVEVSRDKKRGIMDMNGKLILPLGKYSVGDFGDGLINIRKTVDEKDVYEYIDKEGNILLQLEGYDYARPFCSKRAVVGKDNLFGFIDTEGNLVIPCKYERADTFNKEGITLIKHEGKYGLIDINDNVIVPIKYETVSLSYPTQEKIIYYLGDDKYDIEGNKIE
ncbi:WG repeat-containing protein, partial [Dysgonomonas sp. OttesenSCG-928-M03]|nr:WG repeat-containing protein [Dysgonomonas sp. OttesenSCG-928-M03]